MFERATRKKLRFNTSRGALSVEQLWDMPLTSKDAFNLDTLARGYHKELEEKEISFIKPVSAFNSDTTLRFNIVKHIIAHKLKKIEQAEKAAQTKARKSELLELIKAAQMKEDSKRSISDLMKEYDSL